MQMLEVNPLDLKIHINEMKSRADNLDHEATKLVNEAAAIRKEASKLGIVFKDNLDSVNKTT